MEKTIAIYTQIRSVTSSRVVTRIRQLNQYRRLILWWCIDHESVGSGMSISAALPKGKCFSVIQTKISDSKWDITEFLSPLWQITEQWWGCLLSRILLEFLCPSGFLDQTGLEQTGCLSAQYPMKDWGCAMLLWRREAFFLLPQRRAAAALMGQLVPVSPLKVM